jgi:nitrite reductase/ring-hydroxylating ferredoxin subunit
LYNGRLSLLSDHSVAILAETAMSSTAKRLNLCATSEVAPGTALKVEIGDLALAVFNVDGEFFVTDDLCTHGPGSLSEGYIEGDIVECNFHNGQFNIRTGEVVSPPCMVPAKTYQVTIIDGRVTIET